MENKQVPQKPVKNGTSSKVAEYLNTLLLRKSNESDLYESLFSNRDTTIFSDVAQVGDTEDERRNTARYEIPMNVLVDDTKQTTLNLILNLSRGGLKLESSKKWGCGDNLELFIPFMEYEDVIAAQGTVVWTRQSDHSYEYGITFDQKSAQSTKLFDIFSTMLQPEGQLAF